MKKGKIEIEKNKNIKDRRDPPPLPQNASLRTEAGDKQLYHFHVNVTHPPSLYKFTSISHCSPQLHLHLQPPFHFSNPTSSVSLPDAELPYLAIVTTHETNSTQQSHIHSFFLNFYKYLLPMAAMEVVVKLMESQSPPYYAPPQHHGSSRPTIGFPLGTALLLIVVFSLSGIFSCCYHWDKLRHLRGEFSDADPDSDHADSKPKPIYSEKRQDEDWSLPVIMAGDQFARFIAMPCPCEPPRQEKIEIQKPPHIAITM